MAKQHTFAIGAIEVSDRLKTVARDRALQKAAAAINRMEDGPVLFAGPPAVRLHDDGGVVVAVVVWPLPIGGWAYGYVDDTHARGRMIASGFDSQDSALWAAVSHVASLVVDSRTDADHLDKIQAWAADVLLDESQAIVLRADLKGRVAWLRRYYDAIAAGHNDNEAREIAGLLRPI